MPRRYVKRFTGVSGGIVNNWGFASPSSGGFASLIFGEVYLVFRACLFRAE